jgi:hypothetical protein
MTKKAGMQEESIMEVENLTGEHWGICEVAQVPPNERMESPDGEIAASIRFLGGICVGEWKARICVACGDTFDCMDAVFDGDRVTFHNHHCDQERIAAIEAGRSRYMELGRQLSRSFSDRLREAKDMYLHQP